MDTTAPTTTFPSALARVVATVSTGFVVTQLDVTIVNIALAHLAGDLHLPVAGLQWVVDAYTLAFAVLMLSGGALGDRFGARRLYISGLVLFAVTLTGVLVPTTALALPLYLLATDLRLVDTFWAVFLPLLTNPFGVYLARAYAEAAVPDEVLEAARMDGAGELRTFFTVALPMMVPGVVTVLLFQFVGIWNNYFLPLVMLSDDRKYPITLGLTTWQAAANRIPELNQLTVGGAFLSILPLAAAMLVLQRYWRSGLTQGSVKG